MRKDYTWLPVEADQPRLTHRSAVRQPRPDHAKAPSRSVVTLGRGPAGAEEWLFVRGEESIRMIKVAETTTLMVYGPGPAQNSNQFDNEASLEEFRQSHEQRVLRSGWVLLDVGDRRVSGRHG